ncbi:MAG: DUF460 domain-containing protein [Methanocellales archaeon]|nr:DUF460 domain-containing protein [Methanocellales archaeon]
MRSRKRRYLIVGVDPGTTTAIAILDLKGKLLSLSSSRSIPTSSIVEHIAAYGHPLIIATDVTPPPTMVEKIKRAFHAVLFSPKESLPTDEKIALTKSFECSNDHERDALAAARMAFKDCKNKFAQIEKKTPAGIEPDEVKALVVQGVSVDSAITKLSAVPKKMAEEVKETKEVDERVQTLQEAIHRQKSQINRLRAYVDELQCKLSARDEKIKRLTSKTDRMALKELRKLMKTKEISARNERIAQLRKKVKELQNKISRLSHQIDQLKGIRALETLHAKPVKAIRSFTKDSILEIDVKYGLKKGDVIFLEDASGGGSVTAKMLVDRDIKAVIIQNEMSHSAMERFLASNIPVFTTEEISIRRVDDLVVIDPSTLDKAIARWKARSEKTKFRKKIEILESILEEYRNRRLKGH